MRYFSAKRYKNIKHLTRSVKNMEKEEILFTACESINQFKNQQKKYEIDSLIPLNRYMTKGTHTVIYWSILYKISIPIWERISCCCCCSVTSVVSHSVWPHRQQPTMLPRPMDSPGKNTGVGCHFLLQCIKVKSESEVAQLCPTLRDPMDCSLPGSSVHGFSRQEYWSGVPLP